MSSSKDISAKLASLSPAQREALLKKLKKGSSPKEEQNGIVSIDRNSQPLELSHAQLRLWFLNQLFPNSGLYNIAGAIRLVGNLDAGSLRKAIESIVNRHEALRTNFIQVGETIEQRINPTYSWTLSINSLEELPKEKQQEALAKVIREEAKRDFDLSSDNLLRTQLLRLSDTEHVLLITIHHIVSDGWSVRVFFNELTTLYSAYRNNTSAELVELPIQYADYADWQNKWLNSGTMAKQIEYWRKQLQDLPVLELPTDYQKNTHQDFTGNHFHFELTESETEKLKELGKKHNASLFMVLSTIYTILLFRYTNQTDICLGTPVANRGKKETEGLIGFFANTIPLRTKFKNNDSFSNLLKKISQVTLDAYSNQDVPFEKLVETLVSSRDKNVNPIFQTFFSLDKVDLNTSIKLPDLTAQYINADIDVAKFDLSLNCKEQKSDVSCEFEFSTALFERSTIERMANHFRMLISEVLKKPDAAISDLKILTNSEKSQILDIWNNTDVNIPESTVHKLFEQQVEQTPEATAVKHGNETLSYSLLNKGANQLANYLSSRGVKSGSRIGICLNSGVSIPLAILATLKTGASYVPMDTRYPKERLEHIINTANIDFLISESSLKELQSIAAYTINIDENAFWTGLDDTNPLTSVEASSELYTIFTSGSTGVPKGAAVTHQCEVNLLSWYTEKFSIQSTDNILIISALGFDLTQKNIFAPLISGATLIYPEMDAYDDRAILKEIQQSAITLVNCAPSAFYPLVDNVDELANLSSLRTVLFGGEPIRMDVLRPWLESDSFNASIVNMYGPTECTDIAASYTINNPLNFSGKNIPIGRPNSNVKLYVLDENRQLLPVGITGELYIGGAGVGLGYINNELQTASSFIQNPFGPGKLYKTGDLVKYSEDGNLEFIDRIDGQVKIRGFRIELGEIESRLKEHSLVRESIVAACDSAQGKQLVAYVIPKQKDADILKWNLKEHLKSHLPEYMVPQVFLTLEKVPLTPNGKIDRRNLPAPDFESISSTPYVAPRNEIERTLVDIWQKVICCNEVGVNDNFFESGGHSLLATKLITRISSSFDVELPMKAIFDVPTVAGLAEIIAAIKPDEVIPDTDGSTLDSDDFEEGII